MQKQVVNQIERSRDGNYIVVDGREYVCVEHIVATQNWLQSEKSRGAAGLNPSMPVTQQANDVWAA
ncbi:MAG: hypothetical protein HRU21_04790 [Pseudomonadales bacterium]|nr:hypothetical protein [Pseudomonadales bacterium]